METQSSEKHLPALLFGIVLDIIHDMPLDVRVSVADLEEDEIKVLELTLGDTSSIGCGNSMMTGFNS